MTATAVNGVEQQPMKAAAVNGLEQQPVETTAMDGKAAASQGSNITKQ